METIFAAKENKTVSTKEEMINYYLQKTLDCDNEMTDDEKKAMEARIESKLKRGKKLSAKEMEYLRKYNPMMYIRALRIQKAAEAVKEQLKQAKSKEQVTNIVSQSLAGISDKDPDKEYMVAAINEVAEEFKKTSAYARLPDTDADAAKRKTSTAKKPFEDSEDDGENEEDDLMSWTPLSEVIESLPTFSANA